MTTVAFKDGCMAGDTQTDFHKLHAEKVFRDVEGNLYGICGELAAGMQLVEWLSAEEDVEAPAFPPGTQVNVLLYQPADGSLYLFDAGCYPIPIKGPFVAIGSGSAYAMGAMASGKTAQEAVLIASMFDSDTGDTVDILTS